MGSLARKIASLIDSSGDIRVGNLDNAVVDLSNYYTKSQTDGKVVELAPATDLSDYYTKTETDTELTTKAPIDNAALTGSPMLNGEAIPKVFNQAAIPSSGFNLGDFWYDTEDDIMSVCIEVGSTLQWKEV
jgi:hypothetical protein